MKYLAQRFNRSVKHPKQTPYKPNSTPRPGRWTPATGRRRSNGIYIERK